MANLYLVVFDICTFFYFSPPLGVCIPRTFIPFHYINEKLSLVKKKKKTATFSYYSDDSEETLLM